jgi:hypothetical protein
MIVHVTTLVMLAFFAIGVPIAIVFWRDKLRHRVLTYICLFCWLELWQVILFAELEANKTFVFDYNTSLFSRQITVFTLFIISALSLVITHASRTETKRLLLIYLCPILFSTACLVYLSEQGGSLQDIRNSQTYLELPPLYRNLWRLSLLGNFWGLMCFLYYCIVRIRRLRQLEVSPTQPEQVEGKPATIK